IVSFFLEANAFYRAAYSIRFLATLIYLRREFPFRRAPQPRTALGSCLRIAFTCLVWGFFRVVLLPGERTGLLHLTLIGGFAVLTFVVATRVVYGHSGNLEKLQGRNRWLLV